MLFFLLLVFKNLEKSRCRHNDVSYSILRHFAAIFAYRATTDDDGRRRPSSSVVTQLCRQVDVRRRAVCERALKVQKLQTSDYPPAHRLMIINVLLSNITFFIFCSFRCVIRR